MKAINYVLNLLLCLLVVSAEHIQQATKVLFVMQIAVMHAYIDQENYSSLTIDAALRELLKGFRLPGVPSIKP